MQNTEKQEPLTQFETHFTENQNTTDSKTTKPILTPEGRIDKEVDKEDHDCKEDYISFLRKQDWKKVKGETEKVRKLLPNIPTSSITQTK